MEKRVKGLQEEVTRLQNSQDRIAERLQAIEIQRLRSPPSVAPTAESADTAPKEVSRPPLKIVKVQPGPETAPPADGAVAQGAAEDDGAPRPVIKDHGQKPAWWQKPKAKPAATVARAPASGLGQNESNPK
jgi:hypothetical protein